MMRKYVLIIMYLAATAYPAAAQVLTLDTCYALALKNYPLIKQYELIEKTKEYTLSNANKAYLPSLSITGIEGYIFGGLPPIGGPATTKSSNFKFIGLAQLNQTIWDGGATKTQKKIIEASSEADKASLDVMMYDLRSRINQLFFGILLVDEQTAQLEVQNTILTNNINRIKLLTDNGLSYKTDLDEIKVEQLKLNQQKTEQQYVRNGYVVMLSMMIGAKINEQTILQKPAVNNSLPDAQIVRPELALYKSQRDLTLAQAGMQKVNLMPKVGLLGAGVMFAPGIAFGNSEMSSLGVAGLNLSWSISGFYKNGNEKQLTAQSMNKINLQEETFLFNTRLQAAQTTADIEKQKAILAEDDEIVRLRKSIREGYQVKYNAGSATLMDLLNATDKESESLGQKALHEMQLLMTLSNYKNIIGN